MKQAGQRRVVVTGLGVVTSIGHDVAHLLVGAPGREDRGRPRDALRPLELRLPDRRRGARLGRRPAHGPEGGPAQRPLHPLRLRGREAGLRRLRHRHGEGGRRQGRASSSAPGSGACTPTRRSCETSSSGARGRSRPSRSRRSSATCAPAWWRSSSAPGAPTSGWSPRAPPAPTRSARPPTRSGAATPTSWWPAAARPRSRPSPTPRSAR